MNFFLKSISYIFHPILIPFLGAYVHFLLAPKQFDTTYNYSVLLLIFLLTIVLPLSLSYALQKLKIINSIHLKTTRERIVPLILNAIIVVLVIRYITPIESSSELYYFFTGILFSTVACLFLAFLKFKASIHMIAISGLLMYLIATGVHLNIDITALIALLFVITGALATSRLYMKAHTFSELLVGVFIGFIPQLILINYWL